MRPESTPAIDSKGQESNKAAQIIHKNLPVFTSGANLVAIRQSRVARKRKNVDAFVAIGGTARTVVSRFVP